MTCLGEVRPCISKRSAISKGELRAEVRAKPATVMPRLDRGIQGGFNRSSQHFSEGGCDGEFCASRPAAGGATGGL